MEIDDLITPALIIDKSTLLRNIQKMATKVQHSGVQLRPHVKTHKCLEIANLQAESGAAGLTVSTIGEATVFINQGFSDVTLAYPIIPDKFPALMEQAQQAQVNIVTDHSTIITLLEAQCIAADTQLNVLLKIDCGYHRFGLNPSDSQALILAKQIADASHLTFGGILTHAGHAYTAKSPEEIRTIAETEQNVMIQFSETLERNGIDHETVSIGSTPTAMLTTKFKEGITEIRPGNYVFFDNTQVLLGSCQVTDCALTVLASVVSIKDSHVIMDAGATVLSKDAGAVHIPPHLGYGVVLMPDDSATPAKAEITSLSQEHGKIRFTDNSQHRAFSPGNHLRIIPNHSCLTANLFDQYFVVDGTCVVDVWPIHRDRLSSPLTHTSS